MFRGISPKENQVPRGRPPDQGTKSLELGFFSQAVLYKLHNDWDQGDANDYKDDQTEVVLYKRQVAKKISCGDEQAYPYKGPEHIVKEKTGVLHFARPGHKVGIGALTAHKPGDYTCLPPIFGKVGMCLFQVAHL